MGLTLGSVQGVVRPAPHTPLYYLSSFRSSTVPFIRLLAVSASLAPALCLLVCLVLAKKYVEILKNANVRIINVRFFTHSAPTTAGQKRKKEKKKEMWPTAFQEMKV